MLSDNKRSSLLLRKNTGRTKLDGYKHFFLRLGLEDLDYINLEHSDTIIEKISTIFPSIERDCEMIDGKAFLSDSVLLSEIYLRSDQKDFCYVFIDDVEFCGMFKANLKSALSNCLGATKIGDGVTFFLVDYNFNFSFVIDYYNENDGYDKDKFDIRRQIRN